MKNAAHPLTSTMLVDRILGCTSAVKKHNPTKKRDSDSCRRRGSTAAISKSFHFFRPWKRKKRMRRRSIPPVRSMARYSRSQDLTRMPNDAVERLRIRLANQHTLTRMSAVAAWNGVPVGGIGDVEFRMSETILKLLI